jgi:hypothetical protein
VAASAAVGASAAAVGVAASAAVAASAVAVGVGAEAGVDAAEAFYTVTPGRCLQGDNDQCKAQVARHASMAGGMGSAQGKGERMDHRELLTNFYLFTDATANDVRALEAICEPQVCIAGDLVYREGEAADALFLIEMGTVDITPMGKETVFVTMGSGQGFGELSFFEHGPRPAAAYAREPSHLVRIPFARLSQVLAERPDLALLVYRNACAFFAKHMRRMAHTLNHRYL